MELKQLRYFVVLAEELHFGKAADRLGIGHPALSRSIQELERELGRSLLNRDSGTLALSQNGRSFADGARRILADQTPRDDGTAHRVADAALRVGQLGSLTSRFVPRMVSLFRERHPEVGLALSTGNSPDHVSSVRSRTCDVAFVRLPMDLGPHLEQSVVEDEPLRVVMSPNNPLAAQAKVSAKQLLEQPFVFFPRDMNPEFHQDVLHQLEVAAGMKATVMSEAPTLESLLSLVLMCNAATVVSAAQAHDAPRYGLSVRDLAPRQRVRLGLVWRRDTVTPSLQAFLRVAQALAPVDETRLNSHASAEIQHTRRR